MKRYENYKNIQDFSPCQGGLPEEPAPQSGGEGVKKVAP
jgi:hypothetical protein